MMYWAMDDMSAEQRRLGVKMERAGSGRVRIDISHSGLQSSALAAQEWGGTLTAHSEGPGHGATFRLELPSQPIAEARSA